MKISRRTLFAGTALLAAGVAAPAVEACSLIGRRRAIGFSDAACRRSLQALVTLIHQAPKLADDALAERLETVPNFDDAVSEPIVGYDQVHPIENRDIIRGWSQSEGQRDRMPIRLREVNLLKGERGVALYQFTLRRERYRAEVTEVDGGSCDSPAPAHFEQEDRSYLGVFLNNRLREVSAFDDWLRTL